jgi:4-amino-4-deoxy-L-arabinose transferase-like glycosyltransferase
MRLRELSGWAGLVLVVGLFAVPLLLGLGDRELHGDESIYAYAVERIVETGHWLTPRSIPADGPFLEKPPLKMWLVAGGMALGVLPRDEAGMRLLDAVLGAIAFLYVYLLGRRLAGAVCGSVAVLVLFTLAPLVFGHGLRSNNMEAAVFLCYCAGVYHFVGWAGANSRRAARGHALAAAAAFVLGFMTKDVAALFLPLIAAAALLVRPGWRARVREGWRDWVAPAGLVLVLSVPWFVYESARFGSQFWQVIIGQHVIERFRAALDPGHLHPWDYYFTMTWNELVVAGSSTVGAAGIVGLTVAAWRHKSWLARVVWIWGVLPLILMSLGTSKLPHYAYPFWPPIALGAGLAVVFVVRALDGRWAAALSARMAGLVPRAVATRVSRGARLRHVLLACAGVALAMAIWTAVAGPFRITAGGVMLFRNSSVVRPAILAAVTAWLAGQSRTVLRLAGLYVIVCFLPLSTYADTVQRTHETYHPLRTTRDCVEQVQTVVRAGAGVLNTVPQPMLHDYYYYFRGLGPYVDDPDASAAQVAARLSAPGRQTPVIVSRTGYDALLEQFPTFEAVPAASPSDSEELRATLLHDGFVRDDTVAVLLPGPFRTCVPEALAAGGRPLWGAKGPGHH